MKRPRLQYETAQAIDKQYAVRGLRIVSIAVDEGDDLAKLDDDVSMHKPIWPVLLDDPADFTQKYIQGGYYFPAYVRIGRDQQAWWINGCSPLATNNGFWFRLSRCES